MNEAISGVAPCGLAEGDRGDLAETRDLNRAQALVALLALLVSLGIAALLAVA